MDESMEEDRLGVQQDIQEIHRVLVESEEEDDEEEEDHDSAIRINEALEAKQGNSSTAGLQMQESVPEASAENLLQINLSYQDLVCTLLEHVSAARKKNQEIQQNVTMKTVNPSIKGTRPIAHFHKHYFTGTPHMGPPLSEEAQQIKAHNAPNPFTPSPKPWSNDEDRALYEGVRNDGLQRLMQPLMAKQELLYAKLKDPRANNDEEKRDLTKEINTITEKLEEMNSGAQDEELIGHRMRPIDWMKISSLHLNGERSELECQYRWQNALHPWINSKEFTKEEQEELDKLVLKYRSKHWERIAAELGNNRTPFQCFCNYQEREIKVNIRRPITEEEDELIPELVESFQVGDYIHFNKVAYFLDQRLPQQIVVRWNSKLNPNAKFGFWKPEEDEALLKGIELYGLKWSKLVEVVKGRRPAQIRDRWLYTLNPVNKKGNYTMAEDLVILQSAKELGVGNWVEISNKISELTNNNRTPNSVLHRFNGLFHGFFRRVKGMRLCEEASLDILNNTPLNTILDQMIEHRKKMGEGKLPSNQARFQHLYNKKRRNHKKREVSRLLPINASVTSRLSVHAMLEEELTDAIKPVGWVIPASGVWRRVHGSKSVRKETHQRLFYVLLKALALNVDGERKFFGDRFTRKVEVKKEQKYGAESPHPDDEGDDSVDVDSRAKEFRSLKPAQKTAMKKKGAALIKAPDPASSSVSSAEQTFPSTTGQALPPTSGQALPSTFGQVLPTVSGPKRLSIKVEPRDHSQSVFGQGTIQLPGKGFLIPVQNYISQFGPNINKGGQILTLMQPPRPRLISTVTRRGGLTFPLLHRAPATHQNPRLLIPHGGRPGFMFSHDFQPYPSPVPIAQPGVAPLQQQLNFPLGAQQYMCPEGMTLVPGSGSVIPMNRSASPALLGAQGAILPGQSASDMRTMPSAGSTLSNAASGSVSAGQVSCTPTSSTGKGVVHVTVVEGDDTSSMSVHVQNGDEEMTLNVNEKTSSHNDVGNNIDADEDVAGQSNSEKLNSGATAADKEQSGPKPDIKDHFLPILPPNEATINAFMKILLQRKQLETHGRKTKSFQSYHSKADSKKGILRGEGGLLEELVQKSPLNSGKPTSKQDATDRLFGSDSKISHSTVTDGRPSSGVQKDATSKMGKQGAKKGKDGIVVSERTEAEHANALEIIRESDWYNILKQRFLSMFLWPAVLSVVTPHNVKAEMCRPQKERKISTSKQDDKAKQNDNEDPSGQQDRGSEGRRRVYKRRRKVGKGKHVPTPKPAKERQTKKCKRNWKIPPPSTRQTRSAAKKNSREPAKQTGSEECVDHEHHQSVLVHRLEETVPMTKGIQGEEDLPIMNISHERLSTQPRDEPGRDTSSHPQISQHTTNPETGTTAQEELDESIAMDAHSSEDTDIVTIGRNGQEMGNLINLSARQGQTVMHKDISCQQVESESIPAAGKESQISFVDDLSGSKSCSTPESHFHIENSASVAPQQEDSSVHLEEVSHTENATSALQQKEDSATFAVPVRPAESSNVPCLKGQQPPASSIKVVFKKREGSPKSPVRGQKRPRDGESACGIAPKRKKHTDD